MQQNLAKDDQVNQRIADYYQRAIDEINQTIDANARLLVDENGNQTGYKTVSKEQMEAYQREAKAVVDQANQMRANGHRPTYDDFPTEVNRRMRVYNATMRINRLELLKSRLGTILLPATMQTDWDLQDRLSGDYIAECKRQAGIMEVTARPTMWTQAKVAKIVMAQTGGATFSQRLWANQDALKARLDQVVANGIIQGQNPREMARRLKSQVRDTIVNQRYVTERIARTESARVQFMAQLDSIKANGYQYVQWFAEIRACSECKAIANRNNGYGPGIYKVDEVPKIPEDSHPNCRCSISETWVDGENNLSNQAAKKDSFKALMATSIKRLHEQEIIQLGSRIYDALATPGKMVTSKVETLKQNFGKINGDYEAGKFSSYDEYLQSWRTNIADIKDVRDGQADLVAKEISKYRPVGSQETIKFQARSSVPLRAMVEDAYQHYPSDWSAQAEQRNTLKVLNVKRGYYDDTNATIAANKDSYNAQSTMYHELGHRAEHTNPEIMRLEQEFYERRTKGESLQPLSKLTGNKAYNRTKEQARPDDFKNPYMGKEYVDVSGNHYGYELLSMGVEGIFQGRYNLYEDPDMAKFILGLLLKG